jgi:hypothetical protein
LNATTLVHQHFKSLVQICTVVGYRYFEKVATVHDCGCTSLQLLYLQTTKKPCILRPDNLLLDNIKGDLKEIGLEDVHWIHVAHERL